MSTRDSYQDRLEIAIKAEDAVANFLKQRGIPVERVGQEEWLPKWTHAKMRQIKNDAFVDFLRHFPDLTTGRALIQVKASPHTKDSPRFETVFTQKSSFETSKRLTTYGVPVLMIWAYGAHGELTGDLYGNWVHKLTPIPQTNTTKGSRAPSVSINKKELKPITDFMHLL